jgi:hypothetical protein
MHRCLQDPRERGCASSLLLTLVRMGLFALACYPAIRLSEVGFSPEGSNLSFVKE